MSKLPVCCYALHPLDKRVIGIFRNQNGFHETDGMTVDDARAANEEMGVTCAQINAMVNGSMFGWNVPGVNPDTPMNQFFDPYKID